MEDWNRRPVEIANLLNPAFCSLLLRLAISEYEKQKGQGIELPLLFLIMPLVLYRPTRDSLPKTSATKLHVWLQGHQEVRVGLNERISTMVPYTREALLFGVHHGILRFNDDGTLVSTRLKLKKPKNTEGQESTQCQIKATFIGRWFSTAGDAATVLNMFGLRV